MRVLENEIRWSSALSPYLIACSGEVNNSELGIGFPRMNVGSRSLRIFSVPDFVPLLSSITIIGVGLG